MNFKTIPHINALLCAIVASFVVLFPEISFYICKFVVLTGVFYLIFVLLIKQIAPTVETKQNVEQCSRCTKFTNHKIIFDILYKQGHQNAQFTRCELQTMKNAWINIQQSGDSEITPVKSELITFICKAINLYRTNLTRDSLRTLVNNEFNQKCDYMPCDYSEEICGYMLCNRHPNAHIQN